MKKVYITPVVDVYEYTPATLIAGSLEIGGPMIDGDGEEATDAFRGDWNDIWGDCK